MWMRRCVYSTVRRGADVHCAPSHSRCLCLSRLDHSMCQYHLCRSLRVCVAAAHDAMPIRDQCRHRHRMTKSDVVVWTNCCTVASRPVILCCDSSLLVLLLLLLVSSRSESCHDLPQTMLELVSNLCIEFGLCVALSIGVESTSPRQSIAVLKLSSKNDTFLLSSGDPTLTFLAPKTSPSLSCDSTGCKRIVSCSNFVKNLPSSSLELLTLVL